jgi:ParB family chromosome partitioning protein
MNTHRGARGLGRGLSSLIPDSALDLGVVPPDRGAPRTVPIDEVRPNPEQPRESFDEQRMAELAASIRRHGMLAPLVTRRHEGRYVLLAGERRLRAAALAGLTEVPVVVRDAEDPGLQLELALVENLQRADLDPIETAKGFQRLVDLYGYSQEQVAEAVGKDRVTVANAIRLLKLPEAALAALRQGRISAGHARALLPLVDDTAELGRVMMLIIARGWSVRLTERAVAARLRSPPSRKNRDRQRAQTLDYAVRLLESSLHTSVAIRPRARGGGRIVIDYADGEDLERLITSLRAAAPPSRVQPNVEAAPDRSEFPPEGDA